MRRVYCDDGVVSNFEQASNPDEESQGSKHSQHVDNVINIRGDQFDGNEKADVNLLDLKYTDLWALGLTTAIGSHFFSWSSGLSSGFGSYVVALWFVSTGYFCLILCISELSSALPFAGGAYGIARVTLGIYPGFLIACYDCLKSILCVASAAYSVGRIITIATNGPAELQFLYWSLFYMYGLAINGRGGVFFWRVNKITAAVSISLLLVFIIGSIKFGNFEEYAPLAGREGNDQWFHGGMQQFMHAMPTTTRFFVGIQSIDLACGQIRSPKTEVPKGSMGAVSTVMFTSFAVLFAACSVKPGLSVLQHSVNPLTQGFATMFGIPFNKALCLSLPATITYGVGYMYFYGKQLSAMGRSGLLPFVIGNEIPVRNTPVIAHVSGALIGYTVCIVVYYQAQVKIELNNVVILVAMVTYMSIFVSFVFLRWYFPTIKREFISPLGVYGAVYGFLVFLMVFVAVCGFQGKYYAIEVFGVITVLGSVYYYFVVQKRQVFSDEERTVMFKAYLMKNNMARSSRIKRGGQQKYGAHSPARDRAHSPTPHHHCISSHPGDPLQRVHSGSNMASVGSFFTQAGTPHDDNASLPTLAHYNSSSFATSSLQNSMRQGPADTIDQTPIASQHGVTPSHSVRLARKEQTFSSLYEVDSPDIEEIDHIQTE